MLDEVKTGLIDMTAGDSKSEEAHVVVQRMRVMTTLLPSGSAFGDRVLQMEVVAGLVVVSLLSMPLGRDCKGVLQDQPVPTKMSSSILKSIHQTWYIIATLGLRHKRKIK